MKKMITISPTHPTSATPVTISVVWSGCIKSIESEQIGHTFHIQFNYASLCWSSAPGGVASASVGLLQPGTYNVEYEWLTEGIHDWTWNTSFQVSAVIAPAVPVPAVSVGSICVLAVAVFIAVFAVRYWPVANKSRRR
ncbi:MAG: hypothetical protein L0H70_03800 [Xanthomonadales bacterium]|nr:hypothetical protein [Xanthomonadales bacterium]